MKKQKILKYFHESKSHKHSFVLCEDFDTLLEITDGCKKINPRNSFTNFVNKHSPFGFAK